MRPEEPGFGEGGGDFPETRWSMIAAAKDSSDPTYRRRLEELCRAYWRPVYAFLRFRQGLGPEEARDVTQEFFIHLLEGAILERADRSRARFRAYLKACLANFASHIREAKGRLKRGGGARHFPIEFSPEEESAILPPDPKAAAPPDVLDREWNRVLIDRAFDTLGKALEEKGDRKTLDIFRAYYFPDPNEPKPTYKSVAEKFGVPATELVNLLYRTRKRFRLAILDQIRDSTASEEEARLEYRELFGEDP